MATPPSKPVKTVTINYTDPAPGQSTQLQILNDTAGNYGEIQFKGRSGNFAATNNLAWDGNTQTLNIRGNIRLTGTIVGNLVGNPSFLKLIGGNAGDILTTDGEGNMSWLPAAETGYSNNDVGNYLANYTGNLRSGNANLGNAARANYFIGNLTGTAQYATTANNVAVANVAGIGNIATINLSGSNSNVLYGNGVWAPASRASENSISNGSTSVSIPSANGNVIVNVSNGTAQWRFGNDGNLTLPGNTFAINYANGAQVQLGGDGSPGPQGDPGPAGADGADALWNWQGAYSAGPQYQEGDIVTHLGSTYRRNGTGNSVVGIAPPDATYWELVAERGVAGNAGARGSMWTSGATDPSGTFFGLQEMDLYLNNTEGTVWQYVGGDWILLDNITGPQGPQGDPGGNANTGNITFDNNTLKNTTALGGEVNIETASQAGDSNKTWSFIHDGAGSLSIPEGGTIRAKHGLSILATDTEFVNYTNVVDFDTNSYIQFTELNIVNPQASVLAAIDPESPDCVAVAGAKVRIMYESGMVYTCELTTGFSLNGIDEVTGTPKWTATIPFIDIGSLIKEFSIEHSANWRFAPNGKLQLPLGGDIVDSTGNSVLGGGGASTGNITFSDTTMTSAGNVTINFDQVASPAVEFNFTENGVFEIPGVISSGGINLIVNNGNGDQSFQFDGNGSLIFPRNGDSNDPTLRIFGGTYPGIASIDASEEGPANLEITALNTAFVGYTSNAVTIHPDDGKISTSANLVLTASDASGDGYSAQQVVTDGLNELSKTSLNASSFRIYTDMQGAGAGDEWRFEGNTLQVTTNSTIRAFGSNVVTESVSDDGTGGTASVRSLNSSGYSNVLSTFDATPTGANIKVYNGGSSGGTGYTWQFDNNGNLNVPFNGAIKAGNLKIYPSSGLTTSMLQEIGNLDIRTVAGALTVGWASGIPNDGNTSAMVFSEPGNIGNAIIRTGDTEATTYNWVFGNDGNLTLPGNTFSINYANGEQVSIGGGGGTVSSLVNGDKTVSLEADGSLVFPGNDAGQFKIVPAQNTNVTTTAPTVIYTSSAYNVDTMKATIQVRDDTGIIAGGTITYNTQLCEILVVKQRVYNNSTSSTLFTAEAMVYGVVHTSATPMATFDAQYNSVTHQIEITMVMDPAYTALKTKVMATESVNLAP